MVILFLLVLSLNQKADTPLKVYQSFCRHPNGLALLRAAQAKAAFGAMGYEIPSEVRLADFAAMVLEGKREEKPEKAKRGRKKKAPRLS